MRRIAARARYRPPIPVPDSSSSDDGSARLFRKTCRYWIAGPGTSQPFRLNDSRTFIFYCLRAYEQLHLRAISTKLVHHQPGLVAGGSGGEADARGRGPRRLHERFVLCTRSHRSPGIVPTANTARQVEGGCRVFRLSDPQTLSFALSRPLRNRPRRSVALQWGNAAGIRHGRKASLETCRCGRCEWSSRFPGLAAKLRTPRRSCFTEAEDTVGTGPALKPLTGKNDVIQGPLSRNQRFFWLCRHWSIITAMAQKSAGS